jgi:uncharacterized surface protein with fasciclin (FAS1) repeats
MLFCSEAQIDRSVDASRVAVSQGRAIHCEWMPERPYVGSESAAGLRLQRGRFCFRSPHFSILAGRLPSGFLHARNHVFIKPIGTSNMTTSLHDIVDTAVAAGSFQTLVAAVTAADLGATLKGAGPFTVFAPSDDAFAKLPEGTVDGLLKPENKAKLVAILTYHVMAGKVMAADVSGKKLEPVTVNGQALHVDGTSGVLVNGAKVVTADIGCTNGVIHVIDAVLMPKS